jgi:hypothetical protein
VRAGRLPRARHTQLPAHPSGRNPAPSQVMGERDILGSQLIRRNDELALLYEKVKLQAAALSRGAVQYRDR